MFERRRLTPRDYTTQRIESRGFHLNTNRSTCGTLGQYLLSKSEIHKNMRDAILYLAYGYEYNTTDPNLWLQMYSNTQ